MIMRGLPGCGKSTASKQLTEAWQTTHRSSKRSSSHTAICSADSFFEAGAGLSRRRLREMAAMPGAPRDTYRLVWSVESVCQSVAIWARAVCIESQNCRLSSCCRSPMLF